MNSEIQELTKAISKLPGIGQKSAAKIALFMIQKDNYQHIEKIFALIEKSKNLFKCEMCNNIDKYSKCSICSDIKRDKKKVCIVSSISSLWSIEKMDIYNGLYYVFEKKFNTLNSEELIGKIQRLLPDEVIFALNTDIESEAVLLYVKEMMDPKIQISRIAQGVPFGSSIEYLDENTVQSAFEARRPI